MSFLFFFFFFLSTTLSPSRRSFSDRKCQKRKEEKKRNAPKQINVRPKVDSFKYLHMFVNVFMFVFFDKCVDTGGRLKKAITFRQANALRASAVVAKIRPAYTRPVGDKIIEMT